MPVKSYADFFLQHLDFAIEYISLHYPFTEAQVIENMPHLIKGSAFYSEYCDGSRVMPSIGLSFNQNIAWTLPLKQHWKVGWQSPEYSSESGGYYDAENAITVVWGNAKPETLFDIIPLHDYRAVVDDIYNIRDTYPDMPHSLFAEEIAATFDGAVHDKLTIEELMALYKDKPDRVLHNESIWEHTMRDALTYDLVRRIIDTYKFKQTQQGI